VTELVAGWAGDSPLTFLYHVVFYLLPYFIAILAAVTCAFIAWVDAVKLRTSPVFAPVAVAILGTFGLLQLRTLLASIDEAKLSAATAPIVTLSVGYALRAIVHAQSHRTDIKMSLPLRSWIIPAVCLSWFALWCTQDFAHDLLGRERLAPAQRASGPMFGFGVAGGLSPTSSVAELEALSAAIERRSPHDESIVVIPNSPYVYYLARRSNLTPYDYIDPVYTTPDVDSAIASAIQAERPGLIVVTDQPLYTTEPAEIYAPATYREIRQSYVEAERIGPFSLLIPRG
jgi:hypothetical protein